MNKSFGLRTIFTSLLILIIVCLAFSNEKTEKVDKLFAQWDKPDSPGCALAIVKEGKIIHKKGYGIANLEHGIPITPKTVFYIGSVSKQFVAMCIALLEKHGKLSFDDDIRKYVPEIPDYDTPITIRHLIHHTSGLRDYLSLLDIAGTDFGYYHEEDAIELLAGQRELNFKPGDKYLYSNSGYFLMAVIVERASGKTLREFAEENIFRPLGMKNSHFHDDYTRLIKNRATGYFPSGKGKYKNFISTFDCVGSGGLFTSVEDLFLWDQNFYHCKVGGKDLINLLHTKGTLNNGERLDYAFALSIGEYKGLKTVGHGGALGGYRSALIRFPEQNFSVICLANLSSFNPTKLAREVADIYLAEQFKEEKDKVKPEEKVKFIQIPERKLKKRVGAYVNRKSEGIIKLFIEKGKLVSRVSGRNYHLEAVNETEFHVKDAPVEVVIKFEKPSEGEPLLLHVYQEGEKPETFEAFPLAKPTPEQLKEYEGDYFSDELQVTFKLEIKKGTLYFVHRNAPKPPLEPTLKDKFTVRGFRINFMRDKENRISSFSLDAGRVKNLCFNKKF